MTKIIYPSGNKDKMREIREIMQDCDVEIISMKEAGIDPEINEDGATFEENAIIKANHYPSVLCTRVVFYFLEKAL